MKIFRFFASLFLLIAPGTFVFANDAPPRGLFVTVLQEPQVLSSRAAIKDLIIFSKKNGIETLFVQIYRANKAWFPSKTADARPYEECLKKVSEDPFAVLIREAHREGIEVHAWVNLLSLSANEDAPILKKYGTDILTRNLEKKEKLQDFRVDNQYFLEPGDMRVRQELETIVGEIVSEYPELDGIQFDYIRYPDVHPFYGYTTANMERFKKAQGLKEAPQESAVWKNWKRQQVTDLLKRLIRKACDIHPDIRVSTTAIMSSSRAQHEAFQDWPLWVRDGTVDFVTLMAYAPDGAGFKKYLADARSQLGGLKKANVAIGAYRLTTKPQIFAEQFRACEESGARGCVVLGYDDFLENPFLKGPLERNKSKVGISEKVA